MPTPHAAVKHELLVRCLDAWAPAALHGQKRASFVCTTPSPSLVDAAVRVFAEFSDLLAKHPMALVLLPPTPDPTTPLPAGITLETVPTGAIFGLVDGDPAALGTVAGDLLAFLRTPTDLPTAYQCRVELVDRAGEVEFLGFGTASEKALEKFKDELWALDEFAGIRLRDPGDPTLLDIAVRPNIGPLRRMLAAELHHSGPQSVGALRAWTQRSSIYRTTDANTALQAMLAAGDCRREPAAGRLTTTTMIEPGPSPARASGRADRRAAG